MLIGDHQNIVHFKVTGNNAGGAGVEGSIYPGTSGTDYVVGLAYKVNDQINLALATAKVNQKMMDL